MDRFTFFRSFHESLQDCTPEIRLEIYDAICAFCFDGKESEFIEKMSKPIWTLIRPVLQNSIKQSENGKKGGAKLGNSNACKPDRGKKKNKPKTSQKQAIDNPETSQNDPTSSMDNGIRIMDNGKESTGVDICGDISPQMQDQPQDEKYINFGKWIAENAPFCANPRNMKQLTEKEFHKLKEKYTSEQIMETLLNLENRKDKRKQYTNLYRTLINWLKQDYGEPKR